MDTLPENTPVIITDPSSNASDGESTQIIQQAQASPFFSNDAIPCGLVNQCQYGSTQACILSLDGGDLSCHDIPLNKGVAGFRLLPSGHPPFYFVDPMNNTLPPIQQEVMNASSSMKKRSTSIPKRAASFTEKFLNTVQDYRPCHPFPEIENQAIFNALFQFALYHWTIPAAFENTSTVQRNGTDWVPPSAGAFYNPLTLLGSCGDDFFCAPTTQLCHFKQKNSTLCVSSNQCMSGVCGTQNSNQSEFPITTSPFVLGSPNFCIGGSPDGHASNFDITQGGNTSSTASSSTHSASFKAGIGAGVGVTVLILLVIGVVLMARRHFAKQRKRMSTRLLAGYIIGKRYRDEDGDENNALVRHSSEMRSVGISRSPSETMNALTRSSSQMSTTPTLADFTTTAGSSSTPHTLLSMPSAPPPLSFHGSIREPSAPLIRFDNDNGGTGLSAHRDWPHGGSSSSPSYWGGSHLSIDADEKDLLLASEPSSSSSLDRRRSLIKDPSLLLVASTCPDIDGSGLTPSAPSLDSEEAATETATETVAESVAPPAVPPKENEEAPPPYTPRS